MTDCCPTCGGKLDPLKISVCLNTNTLIAGGRAIKLSLKHAEISYALWKVSPGTLSIERLITQVYGYTAPLHVKKSLHVQISRLRRIIAAAGLDIVSAREIGYALRPLDQAKAKQVAA